MDFGRLQSLDGVDLTLPPDPPTDPRPARRDVEVLLGAPGWSYRSFVGRIYPRGAAPGEFLAHYARSFSAVELNATWYGYDAGTIARWAAQVPDAFRFCPKVPATITHERRLRGVEREVDAFAAALEGFGPRLGLAWALLPQELGPDRLADLADFLAHAAARMPLAVELRHPGFFADASAGRDAFDLLEAHGVTAVLTDVAGRRDVLHMRRTTGTTMLRFCGNAMHPTDLARLDDWVARLARWRAEGLERVFLFLHQPDEHQTIELAEHVGPRLSAALGAAVRLPRRVPQAAQGSLF